MMLISSIQARKNHPQKKMTSSPPLSSSKNGLCYHPTSLLQSSTPKCLQGRIRKYLKKFATGFSIQVQSRANTANKIQPCPVHRTHSTQINTQRQVNRRYIIQNTTLSIGHTRHKSILNNKQLEYELHIQLHPP